MSTLSLLTIFGATLMVGTGTAHAASVSFSLQDLGLLAGAAESGGWGLDPSGRAVGYRGPANTSGLGDQAVSWSAGAATDLAVPAQTSGARALAATGDGDSVGYALVNSGQENTVTVWWHNGSAVQLPAIEYFASSTITITGTDLAPPGPAPGLTFTSSSASPCLASPVTVNADGSLTALVPSCASSGPVTVSNGDGTATSSQTFTVT